ncbi:MAG: hypothetical protein MUD16_07740 [Desulfobacterales bacterium]|jgi:hypothetical protein|nr:hypothetical protein [Desulfobacterales bacterium]
MPEGLRPPAGVQRVDARVWVVSEPEPVRMDPESFDPEADRGGVKGCRLSELGRYLLHPGPVEIRKRLIGCEVHPARRAPARWWQRVQAGLRRSAPRKQADVILSGLRLKVPAMDDPDLELHLRRLVDELRGYDPFVKKIARLKTERLAHLIGICEDIGGGYSYLKLQGSLEEKMRYLTAHVGREVRVTLHRAHLSEGLFDLRGFPPAAFNPSNAFRLVNYTRGGEPAACVLNALGSVDFRLADPSALRYLSLLEHTLTANPDLQRALTGCFFGKARAVRLFFNKALEVDYAKAGLPALYRSIFRPADLGDGGRNLIKPVLNFGQTAVSLSYLPATDTGEEKLLTQISILHDLRALDPLRKSLPNVYAEISRRAFSLEAGRFYLLDSITGATHGQ